MIPELSKLQRRSRRVQLDGISSLRVLEIHFCALMAALRVDSTRADDSPVPELARKGKKPCGECIRMRPRAPRKLE